MVDITRDIDLTDEDISVMREAAIKSRTGEKPLTEEQEVFMRKLVRDGAVKEEDLFPSESTGETILRTGKNIASGIGGMAGLATSVATPESIIPGGGSPEQPAGPFGESLLTKAGRFLTQSDVDVRRQASGLPAGQRNLADASSLVGAAAVPTNLVIGGGKVLASSLTGPQVRALSGFKRFAVNAAQNPKSLNAMESAIAALAGAAGSEGAEVAGEAGRMLNELIVSFGAPMAISIARGFGRVSLFKAGNESQAEDVIGRYLSSIFDRDPLIEETLSRSRQIENRVPGVRLPLDKASRSPELAAIRTDLGTTRDTIAMDEKTSIAIQKFAQEIKPQTGDTLDRLHSRSVSAMRELETGFENRTNNILAKLEQDILNATDEDALEIGQQASSALLREEEAASEAVREAYQSLGNIEINPEDTRRLFSLIGDATSTVAKDPKVKPDLPDTVTSLAGRLRAAFSSSKSVTDIPETAGLSEALAGKPRQQVSVTPPKDNFLLVLNEIDKDVTQAIRDASFSGKSDEARRAGLLKSGIEDVYDNLLARQDLDAETILQLEQAKELRINLGKNYQDAEIQKVFAKTRQGTLKEAPEDVMDVFIRSGKKAFRGAELYNNIFKGSPDSLALVRREFSRRLRAFATDPDTNKIDPKRVLKFRKKYGESIEAFGFSDEFANKEKAARFAQESLSAVAESRKEVSRLALKSFAEERNPENFIDGLLNNPPEMKRFSREIRSFGGNAYEGYKNVLTERIMNRASKGIPFGATSIANEVLFDSAFLNKLVGKNSEILKEALGSRHLNNLKIFAFALGRQTPVKSQGLVAEQLVRKVPFQNIQNLMSGARAALRGFVRPDFILMQAALRAESATASSIRRRVLERAMVNPQYAEMLVKATRDKSLLGMMRTVFSPAISSAARERFASQPEQDIDVPSTFDLLQGISNMQNIIR